MIVAPNEHIMAFFEVDYLAQQYRWGDYNNEVVTLVIGENGDGEKEFYYITKRHGYH